MDLLPPASAHRHAGVTAADRMWKLNAPVLVRALFDRTEFVPWRGCDEPGQTSRTCHPESLFKRPSGRTWNYFPEGAPHRTICYLIACARPKDLLSASQGLGSRRRSSPFVAGSRSFGRRQRHRDRSSVRRLPQENQKRRTTHRADGFSRGPSVRRSGDPILRSGANGRRRAPDGSGARLRSE
jgi:hypothetical protein